MRSRFFLFVLSPNLYVVFDSVSLYVHCTMLLISKKIFFPVVFLKNLKVVGVFTGLPYGKDHQFVIVCLVVPFFDNWLRKVSVI